MAIREIRILGDPVLREEAREVEAVTPEVQALVRDMFETMYHADGVGLAAPQIGISQRILVIDTHPGAETPATAGGRLALINPRVVEASEERDRQTEGCLSIPGMEEVVERPWSVVVEGLNEEGEPVRVEADALLARALQHEIDHLDGVLFIDRISPLKRRMLVKKFKKSRQEVGAR